ncbi:DUF3613 domain-containing protein [Alcaligenes endophyticus]|uniref:DUF3613 domain-containing protein n=1 Tax=Alcaligenes endophyticus TaxID=1929088 RepID=A0ABT8EHD2_9BURK|nr:DUF3613 domain-containing protein [Alcaligenes endophyticus]MCX5592055.1 DUF3613 domain-containing protein [Alcaligenes endophyticus]MDN4120702.1 DUF3613 domain-containing protein [Alcaligenes endophyticus]
MNLKSTVMALAGLLCFNVATAQTGPLTADIQAPVQTFSIADQDKSGSTESGAANAEPEPYQRYDLSAKQVHPWPEAEGLNPTVQTGRRHIPPVIGIGDDTRRLLRMQADPQRAGRVVPVSGAAASRAWERYVNSFTHPIPEFMEERISTGSTR